MKKIIASGIAFLFIPQLFFNSIYSFSIPLNGNSQSLSGYEGKKILVVTLPTVQNAAADSMLYSLDTLSTAHTNTLKVIAVPSIEDGFTEVQASTLNTWYHSKLNSQVLITDGLYTHKASGLQQHPLFKWLTDVNQNTHFDIDAEGPGYKFFTNGNGQLYGVLRPSTKISGNAVQKTLRME